MKNNLLNIAPIIILLCCFLQACYYDVEEELYGGSGECDTTNVTYALKVEPIINTFCLGCHASSINLGGVTVQGYNEISTYVSNGKLLCTIKHVSGCSPMPKDSPQLDECSISTIETWILNGAPND